MVEALLLDFLLVVAILLLIPLGAFRGGLREVCSAAGLMFGILIGQAWATRWGGWLADLLSTDREATDFVVAAVTAIAVMAIVGYGASATFNSHPGPGGRIFGAAIAAINGIVLAGYLINGVAVYINDGDYPAVVRDGWVSRAFSIGFEWVLLAADALVICLTLFGLVVRERAPAADSWNQNVASPPPVRRTPPPSPVTVTESEKLEPGPAAADNPESLPEPYAPVKIREVRHWEEPQPTEPTDTITGWQKTWPKSATGERVRPPWERDDEPRRAPGAFGKVPPADRPVGQDQTEILKRWIASETNDKPRTDR